MKYIQLFVYLNVGFCIFLHSLQADTTPTYYPPDISFCIVDLKYNKPHLKICEFGQGIYSGFLGHERLFGPGKIWENVWNFIATFHKPIFFIGFYGSKNLNPDTKAIKTLKTIGGIKYRNFKQFEHSFTPTKTINGSLHSLIQTEGILVPSCPTSAFGSYDKVKQKYPTLLVLDAATHSFVLSKLQTHMLFMNDPNLEQYRPKCMILPTHYTKGMADEIIQTMHCQRYVIKPMDAWKGMGIIFVEQKELERTLEKILDLSSREKNDNDETYVFWSQYKKPYFLIESLETSQPVTVNNKSYDATMRVAFGLAYDHGTIVVDFFGAYWKLPEKSLHEDGSLGEIYKSHIKPGICSAEVDKQTYEEVKTILRNILPKVYTKMIIASYSKNQPYSQQQDALTL